MQRFLYISLLLFLFVILGCRRQDPILPPVEEPPVWTPVDGFTNSKNETYSSAVWDDQLYVLTAASLAAVSPEGTSFHYSLAGPGQNLRLYFNKNFVPILWSDAGADFISFFPSANVTTVHAKRIHLPLKDLEADIAGYDRFVYYSKVGIDADDRLLLPLMTQGGTEALYLFEVKTRQTLSWTDVDTVLATRIDIPGLQAISRINLIGENFLVSYFDNSPTMGGTVLVRPDGQFQPVSNAYLWHAFPFADAWYASSPQGAHRSDDQGNSWTKLSPDSGLLGGPVASNMLGYLTVNGRLLLYASDAPYWLTDTNNGRFISRRLKMDGLSGGNITSVTAWRDHLYVTTKTGVFRAALADLD